MHYHYFTLEQRDALERQIRSRIAHPGAQAEMLQRLHSPDYGVCCACGADIPYVRLMEEPAAPSCSACESQDPSRRAIEAQTAVPRADRGPPR